MKRIRYDNNTPSNNASPVPCDRLTKEIKTGAITTSDAHNCALHGIAMPSLAHLPSPNANSVPAYN